MIHTYEIVWNKFNDLEIFQKKNFIVIKFFSIFLMENLMMHPKHLKKHIMMFLRTLDYEIRLELLLIWVLHLLMLKY